MISVAYNLSKQGYTEIIYFISVNPQNNMISEGLKQKCSTDQKIKCVPNDSLCSNQETYVYFVYERKYWHLYVEVTGKMSKTMQVFFFFFFFFFFFATV